MRKLVRPVLAVLHGWRRLRITAAFRLRSGAVARDHTPAATTAVAAAILADAGSAEPAAAALPVTVRGDGAAVPGRGGWVVPGAALAPFGTPSAR